MRSFPLTVIKGGISRLRTRGGVRADWLYDLLNGYVTEQGTVVPREGTVRDAVLPATTRGLCAFQGVLHTFSHQVEVVPEGYECHVLSHPDADEGDNQFTLKQIHFAQPFMRALYVVAEWSDGRVIHYWLASSGAWEADTVYTDGDVVTPTVPNGLLYKPTPNNPDAPTQTWQPLTNYSVGSKVLPTTPNGYYYEAVSTEGDVPISGAFEPSWVASEGAEVLESADGTGVPAATSAPEAAPQVPPEVQDRYGTNNTQISEAAAAAIGLSDSVPRWSPGTLYQPGDLVKPRSVAPVVSSAIPNANFESGDQDWDLGVGWEITNQVYSDNDGKPYQGAWYARWVEAVGQDLGWQYLEMDTKKPVVPGQFVSASCYDMRAGGNNSGLDGQIVLRWYDSDGNLVKETGGTSSNATSKKNYRAFNVQDIAPGGATQVTVAYKCQGTNAGGICSIDAFTWDYVNLTPTEADFTVYQAVQAGAGTSGADEPVWPGAGNTVVDNQVTWLGGVTSSITWAARAIMKSGSAEPGWDNEPGSSTPDGTISWVATTGNVDQAPASKVVAIAAKKVFAADDDIVRFCATVNPLDWESAEDAGYLPVGLNTHGANPTAVLSLYRGNLTAYNSAGMQMWQIDEDPEMMSLLDAIPIGSTYPKASQPVKNDQIFLTSLGFRNLAIAGASTNLQAGNFGEPIDALVVPKLKAGIEPNSIYYPARGQYWGWFGGEVFVLTMNDEAHSWSRYVFPEALTDATLLGNDLYLRTANHKVWKVDESVHLDDVHIEDMESVGTEFLGILQWPHLDCGALGVQKMLAGFDLICNGEVAVQIGYDQRDFGVLTAAYTVSGDTLPGTPIPFPVSAPSFSLKLTFGGGQAWEWVAANLYLNDNMGGGFAG